jgi:RNA polymerase sigma-70 factor, ECF subfamily
LSLALRAVNAEGALLRSSAPTTRGPTKRLAPISTLQSVTAIAMDAAADRVRWEAAYRSAFPRVYRGLLALGARPDEAEDALQDAFVKGFERSSDRPVASVDGWIFVVASRGWRVRRIRDRVLLPWTLLIDREAPRPSDASPDVLSALRKLPLRQRQIVVARYVVGLTQDETAEHFGIARGTVSATTTQAIAALRRHMEVHE